MNECFSEDCKEETSTEFCPECLKNGGILKSQVIEQLDNIFKYHSPQLGQAERYEMLRQKAKELAYLFEAQCPPSREKSLAMTKLEEAVMWANASIARNE